MRNRKRTGQIVANASRRICITIIFCAMALCCSKVIADDAPTPNVDEIVAQCVPLLLNMQEGVDEKQPAEWPYEGVYRVGGKIPIGYRVGGTAIVASALIAAPGWDDDAKRREAVERATEFITKSIEHPLMQYEHIQSTYDVRGWGYTYGLQFLLNLRAAKRVPAQSSEDVTKAIKFFIAGINATEIPEAGGWNYARGAGFDKPNPPAPFMTAPTLMALFDAAAQGFEVDQDVIKRGLDSLDRGRTPSGSFQYAGTTGEKSKEPIPGAVGRMLVSEIALQRAGRSSTDRLRSALDAFIEHWKWLDARRAQTGTHKPPYNIAPYYFYYAHYYAAMAVELLPEDDREKYRDRVRSLLMGVRIEDGTWNDRVFKRTANYGTAMAMMALMMPNLPMPAEWKPASE